MDNKKALELVNSLIEEHNRSDLQNVVGEFLTVMRKQHTSPLRKAIEEVQEELKKIDPTTKLPGTLMVKDQMGDGQANILNPEKGADTSNGIIKADPATAAPMLGSEGKKHNWKDFMGKCMKTLTASEKLTKPYASTAQQGKFHAMEERGEISPKVVHEFDQASKGKKLPEHVAKGTAGDPQSRPDKGFGAVIVKKDLDKALGGVGSPSSPISRPDTGSGAIIVKDDKPHPPGSPEERSHAVSEGLISMPKAFAQVNRKGNDAVDKFFNHLRSLKKPGTARSPENNLSPEVNKSQDTSQTNPQNFKEPSKDTKETIKESADKPFKVQPERPGQANKPS